MKGKMMSKDTTYVLTTRGWRKSKGFTDMSYPYNLFAVVFVSVEGLRFCEVEFSY